MGQIVGMGRFGGRFGATENGCPPGWVLTPNKNCGGTGAGYSNPQATQLQQALNKIGAGLTVDGVIGPKTTAAVNQLLNQNLSMYQVAAQAAALSVRALEASLPRAGSPAPAAQAPTPAAMPTASVPKTVAPPSPAVVPMPSAAVTGGLPPAAGWALVGLNALVAGVGFWFTASR